MGKNVIEYLNKMIHYYENTIRDFIEADDVVELLQEIKKIIEEKGEINE